MELSPQVRAVLEAGHLAHLVTIDPDGAPQVSIIWIGVDGNEIISGHLSRQRKLDNIRRDPRVALSLETGEVEPYGLARYLVVHGIARIVEGGAPELLHRLAQVYIGPGTVFPPMPDPPPGHVVRITPTRIGGHGPWMR